MSRHLLTLLRRQAPSARHIRRTALFIQRHSSSFESNPTPPRLPASQQAEFERLQREASVSSAFREIREQQKQEQQQALSTDSLATPSTSPPTDASSSPTVSPTTTAKNAMPEASVPEDDPGVGVWRGAPPEFDGDVNPKTGEVGGPKNEPLRWGSKSDWSYNGRVTDF